MKALHLLLLLVWALPAWGLDETRLAAVVYATALQNPRTNILTGQLLTAEEQRAEGVWRHLRSKAAPSGGVIRFFRVTNSLRPTPAVLAIAYPIRFSDPPHPSDRQPKGGEEWLLVVTDETDRNPRAPLGEATLTDLRYASLKLSDNWLGVDGPLLFRDLLGLAATPRQPPQTPMGREVARLLLK